MTPSALCQVFVDAIEAQAVPAVDKAHEGDRFTGVVGPPALEAMDRHFGVECGASVRRNINGCRTEHEATITITFVYLASSDVDAYRRIIDDQALVSEAIHDVRQSGVSNATGILNGVIVSGGDIAPGVAANTIEVQRAVEVVYTYSA